MSELTQAEMQDFKVNKTGWGNGPWMSEPDREQWVHAGLSCLVLRHPSGGHFCGYVGVDRAHPAYGQKAFEVSVEVHCGLNYASKCDGLVCHVPEPGMPDDVWWLGFDCGHTFDISPGREMRLRALFPPLSGPDPLASFCHYRPFSYVRREVEKLADQLAVYAPR